MTNRIVFFKILIRSVHFQACTGIENVEEAILYLNETNWDLLVRAQIHSILICIKISYIRGGSKVLYRAAHPLIIPLSNSVTEGRQQGDAARFAVVPATDTVESRPLRRRNDRRGRSAQFGDDPRRDGHRYAEGGQQHRLRCAQQVEKQHRSRREQLPVDVQREIAYIQYTIL